MKTIINGWCGWHKDWGFVLETFDEGLTEFRPWRKAWILLDKFHHEPDDAMKRMIEQRIEKLIREGWRVLPCKVTMWAIKSVVCNDPESEVQE